ncbi:toxic anion resistance protein [Galactobacter caseinivorans]|uniref:Toxic anion resistance protein n=1 Tax=Galactobacter caseinivorans TaxID=2676123 RepID=A0A496PGL0_9MICC|nr:toxic anion resistance protein [Galactobacter caseinivorans]RKW69622.1 toxic anion resistance protein [Galactobacter caseinivorans]
MDLNLDNLDKPASANEFALAVPEPIKPMSSEVVVQQSRAELAERPQVNEALQQKASMFVDDLLSVNVQSPDFERKADTIAQMGGKEIEQSVSASNSLLDRRASSGTSGAGDRVGNTLVDLRNMVTDLDPNRADITGPKKFLKFLPGGKKLTNYLARFESSRDQLNAIVRSLESGQDELRKDNATLDAERQKLWDLQQKLKDYGSLADALDQALVNKVEELNAQGNVEDAQTMEKDALFAVRQRHQDLMTQLVVAQQGYLAYGLIRDNNRELIKGVDRTKNTTLMALTVAVTMDQALKQQERVLEQTTAINQTTSDMIAKNAERLNQQGARIQQQAASSSIDIEKLKIAFQNTFAAMDAVDRFRLEANKSMAQTVQVLKQQADESQSYLERSRRRDGGDASRALY